MSYSYVLHHRPMRVTTKNPASFSWDIALSHAVVNRILQSRSLAHASRARPRGCPRRAVAELGGQNTPRAAIRSWPTGTTTGASALTPGRHRDAIAGKPSEPGCDYSNAKEDIFLRRASFAKEGKPDPGGKGHGTTTPVETTSGTTPGGGGNGKPSTDTGHTPSRSTRPMTRRRSDGSDDAAGYVRAVVGARPADRVGGLAIVLLAAGSAGHPLHLLLERRRRRRRDAAGLRLNSPLAG